MFKKLILFTVSLALFFPTIGQDNEYKFLLSNTLRARGLALPTDAAGYLLNNGTGTLSWGAIDLSGYIPKIVTPAANHFPYQTAAGILIDSTYDAASFSLSAHTHAGVYEPVLGTPGGENYLLQSTVAGVRSWLAPSTFSLSGHNHTGVYELAGATATHAALTTGIHGLAITAGQTLTVTSGGTVGSAAYTALGDYATAGHNHSGTYEPLFTIATWAGTTNVTTLGTVSTGSWHGTEIAADHGGTGLTSYAVGDLLYAPTTSTVGKLADVAVGQVLVSGGVGVAPAWSASPTVTKILAGDGSISAASFASAANPNTGIYFSATNVMIAGNGIYAALINQLGMNLKPNDAKFGWRGGGTTLYSDANNRLDMRGTTNPQTFNVYNTWTNATVFELGFLRATATAVEVGTEKGSGGGTARPLNFYTDGLKRVDIDTSGTVSQYGLSNQTLSIKQATVVVTTTAAGTATATNLIPAGSMVVGVTCRNTTAIAGDAGFSGYSIGDGSDVDRWGANVNPAINETTDLTDCTVLTPPIYAATASVVLTQIGGTVFTADRTIRVTVHYLTLIAPDA